MRAADYIVRRLVEIGVEQIFQVTGRGSLFLSDAVAKNDSLQSISLHHEQACAFAAIANAEVKEGLGAVLVSTGCAATNTLTGVLSAWQDGIPVIFISGQHLLHETTNYTGQNIRTFGQQETNIIPIVKPITKFAKMLTTVEEIDQVFDEAFAAAVEGKPGPVWIDIPLDLQSARVDLSVLDSKEGKSVLPLRPLESQVKQVQRMLAESKRPVFLLGRGARLGRVEEPLIKFLDKLNVPVVYAASAPDTYPLTKENCIGSVGAMGCSRAGNFTVANSDLLLVLGARVNSLTTGPDHCKFAREAKIIVVDVDSNEHKKPGINIDLFIHSHLGPFISSLSENMTISISKEWMQHCRELKQKYSKPEASFKSEARIDLYELAEELPRYSPPNQILVTDSGFAEVILPSNIKFRVGDKSLHPVSQGAMGFGLPATIGAYLAKKLPTLLVVGDGSIMMNLQELESIRFLNLPIKIIVINNNVYSIIKRRQKELFRERTIGTDPDSGISCPNFSKVAECFGFRYSKIETTNDLASGLKDLFDSEGPSICEIYGRLDQKYIEIGLARSAETRKFVRRPIEDQMPFLSREEFLNAMLVKPIDQ